MRNRWALLGAVAVFALGLTAGQVLSQDAGGGGEKAPPAGPTPEEMQAWMEYMTPGEQHKELMEQAGEWTVSGKMWMAPGAPPTEMPGSAKMKPALGGRFLVQEYKGFFMGMPFEGLGITGYDKAKKKYVAVWCDTSGTGMMTMEGIMGEDGKLRSEGEFLDPQGNTMSMRDILTVKDDDNLHIEMYMKGGEFPEEFKVMELNYTRKKAEEKKE